MTTSIISMNLFNLENKIAVVTGGYGHLGSGIVRALLKCNATVIVAGRNEEKFNITFTEEELSKLIFKKIDIMKSYSIDNFIKEVVIKYGGVDILVNNAYSIKGNSQENMNDEDWSYTFEGVLGSAYKMIKAVIPSMKERGNGKIINISSMYGIVSPDFKIYDGNECENFLSPPHYGAAKAAMLQMTRYFAVLLGPFNIHVNSIAPGPFPNLLVQSTNPLFIEKLKRKNPLNKIGKPEDLDGVIALLSSSASNFITGQTIQVDGGWTIW